MKRIWILTWKILRTILVLPSILFVCSAGLNFLFWLNEDNPGICKLFTVLFIAGAITLTIVGFKLNPKKSCHSWYLFGLVISLIAATIIYPDLETDNSEILPIIWIACEICLFVFYEIKLWKETKEEKISTMSWPIWKKSLLKAVQGDDMDAKAAAIRIIPLEENRHLIINIAENSCSEKCCIAALCKLKYPEDAELIRKNLNRIDDYEDYDLTKGWPHVHQFTYTETVKEIDSTHNIITKTGTCACGKVKESLYYETIEEQEFAGTQYVCPNCGALGSIDTEESVYWNGDHPCGSYYTYHCKECGEIWDGYENENEPLTETVYKVKRSSRVPLSESDYDRKYHST